MNLLLSVLVPGVVLLAIGLDLMAALGWLRRRRP
jgi:hypothetical protein